MFFVTTIVFILWPEIDLSVSSTFYHHGFNLAAQPEVVFIYRFFAKIHFLWLLILLALLLLSQWQLIIKRGASNWHKLRQASGYLFVSLLLVPGLLVNTLLKNNTTGRARPGDITIFGGDLPFTAPLTYSGACDTNCSFVSGHAAIAFFTIALAWVFGDRRWYVFGFALGCLVGLTRIMQGGHFLSDVVFAYWVVHFGCQWLAECFRLDPIFHSPATTAYPLPQLSNR
ncbi:phosphatase PAP2 family protein [Halioxenophilus sp. WMMB6]|uniref:phosphatase PAP2 family protein n=1 Tax=Halioxenophilus sp. WMMB6 TaxID=3073815 RepID=UPI00295E212E|nr:phosphatase PAP2 family protein [Halioxenophilus sp. WMMB6]